MPRKRFEIRMIDQRRPGISNEGSPSNYFDLIDAMTDKSHRVYTVTDQTRSLFIAKRKRDSTTNEEVLASAIEKQLPKIVKSLVALGLRGHEGERRPLRLPLSATTLDAIAESAEQTGLPQNTLVGLALGRHCVPQRQRKARR